MWRCNQGKVSIFVSDSAFEKKRWNRKLKLALHQTERDRLILINTEGIILQVNCHLTLNWKYWLVHMRLKDSAARVYSLTRRCSSNQMWGLFVRLLSTLGLLRVSHLLPQVQDNFGLALTHWSHHGGHPWRPPGPPWAVELPGEGGCLASPCPRPSNLHQVSEELPPCPQTGGVACDAHGVPFFYYAPPHQPEVTDLAFSLLLSRSPKLQTTDEKTVG